MGNGKWKMLQNFSTMDGTSNQPRGGRTGIKNPLPMCYRKYSYQPSALRKPVRNLSAHVQTLSIGRGVCINVYVYTWMHGGDTHAQVYV